MAEEPHVILVVDDDEDVLFLAASYLSGCGYTVIQARSGAEGLEILRGPARVDLLLTDLVMPGGLDGFDLARAGRALRPQLKVLFTSGYSRQALEGKAGIECGGLLRKPWRLQELDAGVRQALACPGRGPMGA